MEIVRAIESKREVLSMVNKLTIATVAVLGLIGGAGCIDKVHADDQPPITVTVDNQVINFPGTEPMETNGSVLVPLRGVFEALHAHVDYDASNSTVTATHDNHTVVVPIGSTNATIDGQQQQLSQPAEVVNGTTMVPLRFVAEAFGDYVNWIADTHTVVIQRQHDPMAVGGNPPMPPPPGRVNPGGPMIPANVVMGRLQRVDTDQQPPTLVIRAYGQDQRIPLSRDVTIQRGQHRDNLNSASISDLQPGDQLFIHENDHGRAENVTAIFGEDHH